MVGKHIIKIVDLISLNSYVPETPMSWILSSIVSMRVVLIYRVIFFFLNRLRPLAGFVCMQKKKYAKFQQNRRILTY